MLIGGVFQTYKRLRDVLVSQASGLLHQTRVVEAPMGPSYRGAQSHSTQMMIGLSVK